MDSTPTPTADESPSVSLAYIKNDKICYTIDALLLMRPKEKPKRPKGMKKLQVIFPEETQRKAYVPHSYYQAPLTEDTWLMPDDNFSYDFESSTIDEIEKERLEHRETWDHTDEIPPKAEPEKLKNISNQIKELIGVSPSVQNHNSINSNSQPPCSPLSFETFHATVIGKPTNINDLFRNANESNNSNSSVLQNQSNQPLRNNDPSIITTSDSSVLAFNDPSIMRIPVQSPIVQSPSESNQINTTQSPLLPSLQQQQQQQPLPPPSNIQNQLSQQQSIPPHSPSQLPYTTTTNNNNNQQQHIMYQYQFSQPPPPSQQQQQLPPNGSYPILYQMPRTYVTFKQQSPPNNNNNNSHNQGGGGAMQQNPRMGNQQPLAPIQALKARKMPVVLSASGPEGRYALPIHHQQQQQQPPQQQQMPMPMYVDMGQRVYMRQIDPQQQQQQQQQQYQYYLQQQQQQQQQQQMQYYQQQQQNQQNQQCPPST